MHTTAALAGKPTLNTPGSKASLISLQTYPTEITVLIHDTFNVMLDAHHQYTIHYWKHNHHVFQHN